MSILSAIFVLMIWFCLLPYVGGRMLQYIAPDAISKVRRDELWLVGFGVGQIALVKVLTIISLYGGLHQSSMTLTLAALLLLVIGAGYMKGGGDLQYCFNINGCYSMFQSLKDKFKERDIYLLFVLLISLLLLVVDYNPIRHADALRYHIEYSNYIHETGSIPFVPHNQLALAQDAEVLFSLVHYWFGDEYVKLVIYVNFVFSLLVLYRVYGFYGKDVQKYAVFITVLSPILFLASSIVKPDAIQLFYFSFSLLILLRVFRKEVDLLYLVILGLFVGELVSLKWTGILPFSVLIIVVSVAVLYSSLKEDGLKLDRFKPVFFMVAGVFLVPVYFYYRNYMYTGNPVWPLLSSVFLYDNGSLLYEVASKPSSRAGVISAYGFLGYLGYTFFIYKPSILGGIGVSNYLLLLWSRSKAVPSQLTLLYFFVAVYIFMWFMAQASFRHLIWLLPVIAVLSAYGYSALKVSGSTLARLSLGAVYLLMFVQFSFLLVYSWFYIMHAVGVVDDSEYFMTTPHYNIFNRVNNDISNPSSVVLSLIPSSELYYLKQPHIDGNISHSAIVDYYRYQSSIELANYLRDLGVDYILYDKDLIEQPQYTALREVVANSESIDSYTDMVLTNRLTGATRSETLFLVRLP